MISSLVATMLSLALAGGGIPVAEPGDVTGVEILFSESLPSVRRTEVVISIEGRVETRDFTMEGPERIVIDLIGASFPFPQESLAGAARGGVLALRVSQYSEDVVRVVLQVAEPVGYFLSSGAGYVRISLENPGGDFEPWAMERGPTALAQSQTIGGLASPGRRFDSALAPISIPGRAPRQDFAEPITFYFSGVEIREVLSTFADFAGLSIVPSAQVSGTVDADIQNQPWDIALQAILQQHNLAAREADTGIIFVNTLEELADREVIEPLATQAFRVNFVDAADLQESIETLLSDRGQVSVSTSANSLIVTDVPRVLDAVDQLINGLDLRRPQITISSRIIFIDRTDLAEFGVVYDLKDSRGNQLNQILPGAIDEDNDGLISDEEQVDIGTNVISLGGNSIAALGNANSRVVNPSIQFLTSLIVGRHTLIGFIEALQSVNLSDVQAPPRITTLDNETARILVGERTPIRVIDASGGGAVGGAAAGGGFPQATVQIEETGIILEVTPHVTAGNLVRMQVRAERSGLQLLDSDLGVNFNVQEAETSMLVEDGETAVIGGLTVTETTETQAGIPLLQDLPLLGRFFRVMREETSQRDLMILVTPQIQRE